MPCSYCVSQGCSKTASYSKQTLLLLAFTLSSYYTLSRKKRTIVGEMRAVGGVNFIHACRISRNTIFDGGFALKDF